MSREESDRDFLDMLDLLQQSAGQYCKILNKERKSLSSGKRFAVGMFTDAVGSFANHMTDEARQEIDNRSKPSLSPAPNRETNLCSICEKIRTTTYSLQGPDSPSICAECYEGQQMEAALIASTSASSDGDGQLVAAMGPSSNASRSSVDTADSTIGLICEECKRPIANRLDLDETTQIQLCPECVEGQHLQTSAEVGAASSPPTNLTALEPPARGQSEHEASAQEPAQPCPLMAPACPAAAAAATGERVMMAAAMDSTFRATLQEVQAVKERQENLERGQEALLKGQAQLREQVHSAISKVGKHLAEVQRISDNQKLDQSEQKALIGRVFPKLDEALAKLLQVKEEVSENRALSIAMQRQLSSEIQGSFDQVQVVQDQLEQLDGRMEALPAQLDQLADDRAANNPARGSRQPNGRGR